MPGLQEARTRKMVTPCKSADICYLPHDLSPITNSNRYLLSLQPPRHESALTRGIGYERCEHARRRRVQESERQRLEEGGRSAEPCERGKWQIKRNPNISKLLSMSMYIEFNACDWDPGQVQTCVLVNHRRCQRHPVRDAAPCEDVLISATIKHPASKYISHTP